jgi:hypothetical protein
MIYFDESGNSGDNLLDKQQPVFSLVSHNYNEFEAKTILQPLLDKGKSEEIHFKNIHNKSTYHKAIIACLNHELIIPDRIYVYGVLKDYLIVVQIVEYLIEPVLHRGKINLLRESRNVGMANIIYLMGNNGWDKVLFRTMCDNFIRWGRKKIEAAEFYQSVKDLYDSVKNDLVPELLGLILESASIQQSVSKIFEKYAFDPTFPVFVSHCCYWGNKLNFKFDIGLDTSKQLNYWRGMIDFLSQLPEAEVGYGSRKHVYPLPVGNITTYDSKDNLQVQLSDLLVSAYNYLLTKGVMNLSTPLYELLIKSKLITLKGDSLWPSNKVTPEQLGTEGDVDGQHPLDFLAKQISSTPGADELINSTKQKK